MRIISSTSPAILGGDPTVTLDQDAANRWPILTGEDERAVMHVLRDGNVSGHPVIRALEDDYAQFTGMPYALAHNNGTAALMAAFFALGLEPGDEILVPTATFWASVSPMLWFGLVPVFCESEPGRLGLDPDDLERRITGRTRAIVVVHLFGLPSRMSEIKAVADRHGLKIIEDASHAHGAVWRGQPCGSLGDIGVFSLQGEKLAPAGEGGIFLCRDKVYFERAVCLGDIRRVIELDGPGRRFAATGCGMKTRIAALSAALGREQFRRLPAQNKRRNANIEYLSGRLEDLGFDTFLPPDHIRRVYFEFIVRPRPGAVALPLSDLIKALQAEGCRVAAPRYPLLHQQPFFTEGHAIDQARLPAGVSPPVYRAEDFPQTWTVNAALIRLPSFPDAEVPLLDQYAAAFERVVSQGDAILAGMHPQDNQQAFAEEGIAK